MNNTNRNSTINIPALLLICGVLSLFTGCKKPAGDDNQNITTIQYEVSTEIFTNPERGFIHMVDVKSEGEGLNPLWLANLRSDNVSMIMRQFYLDKFKDQPISEQELQLIRADLQSIRDAGIKCILRFAYTDDMAGTDAPLSIVKQHLDQLKPIFEENKDVIAFVQAGFIGAWGEWHHSSNGLATVENERTVLYKLLSVLPEEIMVQVRTPGAKQEIVGSTTPVDATIAYTSDKKARIGHHNDCFLAGGTDYGTYSNIQADKEYISKDALYVPTGGETCPPEGPFPDCATARAEMQLLRWTYLNLDWYQPVLAVWRNSGCFEEFERNLGYRLALMNTKLPKQGVTGEDYNVEITLTNKGYAPLYNYKITSLVFKNKLSGTSYPIDLTTDLRSCKPNGILTITKNLKLTGIPAGDYDLFLSITDGSPSLKNRIEYCVRLANTTTWDENTGLNNLKHQVKITAK
ncbi:MAG: DUF4832 domain-containing protein [Lentimicrobiaceae bacterium]|jgi:hypothetical protein